MRRNYWLAAVAVVAVVAWVGWLHAFGKADDAAAPAEKTAVKDAGTGKPTADGSLTVPNGSAKELLAFINKVREIKPPESEDAIKPFVEKTRGAMLEAANKILAGKPESKTRLSAIQAKVEALSTLQNFADDAGRPCRVAPTDRRIAERQAARTCQDRRPASLAVGDSRFGGRQRHAARRWEALGGSEG